MVKMIKRQVREIVILQVLNKMPQLDFSERRNDEEQEYSLEDKKFLKIKVSQEIRLAKDRNYESPLPVIGGDYLWFTENKEQVIQTELWFRQPIGKTAFWTKSSLLNYFWLVSMGMAKNGKSNTKDFKFLLIGCN